MLKLKLINSLLLLLLISFANAQPEKQINKALEIFDEKPEVYLSFPANNFSDDLNLVVSLDYIKQNRAYVYANYEAFQKLVELNIDFKVERSPGDIDFDPNMKTWEEIQQRGLVGSWDFYPTYEAYVDLMYQFEEDYPDMIEIYNIGETVNGRDLLFAKLTSNVNEEKAVPRFSYTSTMHGDETAGFILLLRLIHHFAENYGSDDEITYLMDNFELWICPNENPDGTYTNDNSTVSGATRGNANGVDLNRNYINPVSQHSVQQPETVAMMNFVDTMGFVMSANMHGGIELVNYPFDSWTSNNRQHVDHDWFEMVSLEYADTAQYNSPSGYMTAFGGTTHGGDWYVVYGSRQDYLNYYNSCREITLELSDHKLLNPASLPAHWDYNYRSFVNYIKQAGYGITGVVTDAATGEGVIAEIELTGHDEDYSTVYSRSPFGNFNRPVLEGSYDVKVTAEGYFPVEIENVSVTNHDSVFLEIELIDTETDEYTLTLDVQPEGTGNASGEGVYYEHSSVSLSASADEGYAFKNWTSNGEEISQDASFNYTMPGEDITLTANFIVMGDVNGDGEINSTDLTMMLSYILGNNPEGFYEEAADMNGDGIVNILDVIALINIIIN